MGSEINAMEVEKWTENREKPIELNPMINTTYASIVISILFQDKVKIVGPFAC